MFIVQKLRMTPVKLFEYLNDIDRKILRVTKYGIDIMML